MITLSRQAHDIVAQITRLWPDAGFTDVELETIDRVWTRLNQTRLTAVISIERARSGKAPNLGRIAIEAGLDDLCTPGQEQQPSAGEMLRIRRAREEAEHARAVGELAGVVEDLRGKSDQEISAIVERAIDQANRTDPKPMSNGFAEMRRQQWNRQLRKLAAGEKVTAPVMEVLYLLDDALRAGARGGLYG